MIHSDGPEERKAGSESIDVDSRGDAGTQVFQSVGQRVGKFDVGCGSGFLHVVARNGD